MTTNSYEKGIDSAVAGAIAGLIVNALLIMPDWGASDNLLFGFAVFINVILLISSVTELMRENARFVAGYTVGSVLMMVAGII